MNELTRRPEPTEHAPYYARYIDLVPDGDIVRTLEEQIADASRLLESIGEERSLHRYAAGKWSVKEVVGHVSDAERVFVYRALAFARGDENRLPGFDEKLYVGHGGFDAVSLADLTSGLRAVRSSTLALLRTLPANAWDRVGIASDNRITVRALAWVMAGHERHHMGVIRERYL